MYFFLWKQFACEVCDVCDALLLLTVMWLCTVSDKPYLIPGYRLSYRFVLWKHVPAIRAMRAMRAMFAMRAMPAVRAMSASAMHRRQPSDRYGYMETRLYIIKRLS